MRKILYDAMEILTKESNFIFEEVSLSVLRLVNRCLGPRALKRSALRRNELHHGIYDAAGPRIDQNQQAAVRLEKEGHPYAGCHLQGLARKVLPRKHGAAQNNGLVRRWEPRLEYQDRGREILPGIHSFSPREVSQKEN